MMAVAAAWRQLGGSSYAAAVAVAAT